MPGPKTGTQVDTLGSISYLKKPPLSRGWPVLNINQSEDRYDPLG